MKSIMEPMPAGGCYLCGRCGKLEEHHIFGGTRNRKLSERYGLKVHLCYRCHRDNKAGVHGDREKMEELQRQGQRAFEKIHSRKEFVQIFGKNYLDQKEPEPQESHRQRDERQGIIWLEREEETI